MTTGLALPNFGPPSHPHGHMISNLWLAVPGHDGVLASANLDRVSGGTWNGCLPGPHLFTSKLLESGSALLVHAVGWATSDEGNVGTRGECAYRQQEQRGQTMAKGGEISSLRRLVILGVRAIILIPPHPTILTACNLKEDPNTRRSKTHDTSRTRERFKPANAREAAR